MYRGNPVGLRDDVGIVPCDHDGLHSVQYTLANLRTFRFFNIHKRFTHAIAMGDNKALGNWLGIYVGASQKKTPHLQT